MLCAIRLKYINTAVYPIALYRIKMLFQRAINAFYIHLILSDYSPWPCLVYWCHRPYVKLSVSVCICISLSLFLTLSLVLLYRIISVCKSRTLILTNPLARAISLVGYSLLTKTRARKPDWIIRKTFGKSAPRGNIMCIRGSLFWHEIDSIHWRGEKKENKAKKSYQ